MYDSTEVQRTPLFNESITEMQKLYDRWNETGIFFWNDYLDGMPEGASWQELRAEYRKGNMLVKSVAMRSFMRACARQLRRPFIIARYGFGSVHRGAKWVSVPNVELTIPRRKYTAEMIAPFMLLPEVNKHLKVASGYRSHTVCTVEFFNPDTNPYWQKFLERCRTDPAYRKAMKLPVG